jgi:hypothetical protein
MTNETVEKIYALWEIGVTSLNVATSKEAIYRIGEEVRKLRQRPFAPPSFEDLD